MSVIKFKFNVDVFKNIEDINFIYYLGFLWADGHNRKYSTEITIKKEDFNNIKHIFDNIEGIDFSYKNINRKNRKPQKCIRVHRKEFCDFLKENDYNEKSHKTPQKILELIPTNKRKYFFRGLIDGDGCFYHKNNTKQFSITSSIEQDWSSISNLFDYLKIDKYSIRRVENKHSYSQIRIVNVHDIKKLCDYIYDDVSDMIYLSRKYDKYIDILNSSNLKIKKQKYNINISKMASLDENGKSVKEIAKYFNCDINSIYRRLRKYKRNNGTYISVEKRKHNIGVKEIIILKEKGKSIKEIAEYFKCGVNTIYKRLQEN